MRIVFSLIDSEVDKIFEILIKTLNATEYIESLRHQEKIILSSSMYEKIYLQGSLERVLEPIQVSNL